MDIVAIQRDEWLAGYMGRLAALNSYDTPFELYTGIRQSVIPTDIGKSSRPNHFDLIAYSQQIKLQTLLIDHTLWRLHIAFRPGDRQILGSADETIPAQHVQFVAQQFRKYIWFCPACAIEDREKIHFSYWRRSHQIPGLTQCARHKVDLFGTSYNGILNFTPDRFIDDPGHELQSFTHNPKSDWEDSAVNVLQMILASEHTVDQKTVLDVLRGASGVDSCDSKKDRYSQIAAEITSKLPRSWLADFMPSVLDFDSYPGSLAIMFAPTSRWQRKPPVTSVALLAARYLPSEKIKSLLIKTGFNPRT